MSGWTYEVTKRRIKERKTTTRAFSEGEAIDNAKEFDRWGDPESHTEYVAREL